MNTAEKKSFKKISEAVPRSKRDLRLAPPQSGGRLGDQGLGAGVKR